MRIISMLMLFLLFSFTVLGAGKITGKITDGKSGEPVIGATVIVKGTSFGASTDIDGLYSISLEPGSYTVEIKYIGYATKEIGEVVVTPNNATPVNAAIAEAKSTELGEVVVRSSMKQENINALYTTQKNNASISDGISADVIRKSPDRSTGEVLKRVSGTTIQDNKFVIVRGLSDRYNTALVDNGILPSTEPNRKAFSFDIIPASMIDNIVITKSATADLPGDFAGGVINILTKEIPEQNFSSLALGFGYNSVSTGKEFKSGYRSATDILGFDDGARQLPSDFPSTKTLDKTNLSAKQSVQYLNMLNNDFSIRSYNALPTLGFQGSLGRVYNLGNTNKRIGVTAALTYNHTELTKTQSRYYDNYIFDDKTYNYNTNFGALVNIGYTSGKSKFLFKNLYNRIFDDNFLSREGLNISGPREVRYYAYDLIQKSLFKSSLEGDHQLGKGQSKIGWLLAYNLVTNNQPDQRKVSYSRSANTNDPFTADVTTIGRSNNRLFGELNEHILNGAINFSTPVNMFSKSTLKIGVLEQYRSRDFANRYLGAVLENTAPDGESIRTRPIETLFGNDVINEGTNYRLEDQTLAGDKYEATAVTSAGYASMDNKISEKIRLVWGVRVENYSLGLTAGDGTDVSRNWLDALPSMNFTYALNERTNLRASYFSSVARPELREVAGDLVYYDYDLNANFRGNYDLQRSQINNADLRYEFYPKAGEIISASVFYKYFNKTLENQFYGVNSSYEVNPANYSGATNIGIEMELRKSLDFIADNSLMKNLNFYANLAYIKSKVKLEGAEQQGYVNGITRTSRPLSGQSPYVVNTSLGYNGMNGKLSVNMLFNRIGQRITLVGGPGRFADVYEMPRNLFDLQASYNVSKKSEFRLNVKDLFNAPVRLYFDQNDNKTFDKPARQTETVDPYQDYVLQEYRPGTTFTLTYLYKF